jgi:hypothetical protein
MLNQARLERPSGTVQGVILYVSRRDFATKELTASINRALGLVVFSCVVIRISHSSKVDGSVLTPSSPSGVAARVTIAFSLSVKKGFLSKESFAEMSVVTPYPVSVLSSSLDGRC